jgi:hypothetical protein
MMSLNVHQRIEDRHLFDTGHPIRHRVPLEGLFGITAVDFNRPESASRAWALSPRCLCCGGWSFWRSDGVSDRFIRHGILRDNETPNNRR